MEPKVFKPQAGPQEQFLSTSADICIYGGAAGGGKSWALLLEPLRHINNPKFSSVTFRRYSEEITMEGGLWSTASEMYPLLGGKPLTSPTHKYTFPSGAVLAFRHFDQEKKKYKFQGAQIPLIQFDELTHFSESMFWYMLSRNRSTCGVKPYIRATTNPDPDSWILPLISWWIDQETGYPIKERGGVVRWFIRQSGELIWADTKEELEETYPGALPKSFTFIPSSVHDNQILLKENPEYLANLDALLDYEQKRLKGGNWFARPTAGEVFKRSYFEVVEADEVPPMVSEVRFWDRAATTPNESNKDPDWTAGVRMGKGADDTYYLYHSERLRGESYDVQKTINTTASQDGRMVTIGLWQDPGSAGKYEVRDYIRQLDGYIVESFPQTKNKLTYWKPLASQAKAGRVKLVRGTWNEAFLREAEGVTDGTQHGHDDQIDAAAGAYMYLSDSAMTPVHIPDISKHTLGALKL